MVLSWIRCGATDWLVQRVLRVVQVWIYCDVILHVTINKAVAIGYKLGRGWISRTFVFKVIRITALTLVLQGFIHCLRILSLIAWGLCWALALAKISTIHTSKISLWPLLNLPSTVRFKRIDVYFLHWCFSRCLLLPHFTLLISWWISHKMIDIVWFHHLYKILVFRRTFLASVACDSRSIGIFNSWHRQYIFAVDVIEALPHGYFLIPYPRVENDVIFILGIDKWLLHFTVLLVKLLDVGKERTLSRFDI